MKYIPTDRETQGSIAGVKRNPLAPSFYYLYARTEILLIRDTKATADEYIKARI